MNKPKKNKSNQLLLIQQPEEPSHQPHIKFIRTLKGGSKEDD